MAAAHLVRASPRRLHARIPATRVGRRRQRLRPRLHRDIHAAIENFRRSGCTYLLATTFVADRRNVDIRTGTWRPLHMQGPPFDFPPPLALVDERCVHTGGIYRDKRLALWRLRELPERGDR